MKAKVAPKNTGPDGLPNSNKADIIQLNPTRDDLLNILGSGQIQTFNHKGAVLAPDIAGNAYAFNGMSYILNREGLVCDFETRQVVLDRDIVEAVHDQFEEDQAQIEAIDKKAKGLAKGDPSVEEALRIHFAFTGIPDTGDASS